MDKKSRLRFGLLLAGMTTIGAAIIAFTPTIANALEISQDIPLYVGIGLIAGIIVLMLIKAPNLIAGEMEDKAAKLEADKDFFVKMPAYETRDSVERKFLNSGFTDQYGMLHKRVFTLAKDFVNYYAILVENNNVEAVYLELSQKLSSLAEMGESIGKNDCYMVVFFVDGTDETVLLNVKNLIISQRMLLSFQQYWVYAVVPIIYDTKNRAYILHKEKKASINPIDLTIRAFYKFVRLGRYRKRTAGFLTAPPGKSLSFRPTGDDPAQGRQSRNA